MAKLGIAAKPNRRTLWYILLAAFVLRAVLSYATEGYTYDMSCFVAWGDKMAAEGAANFYSEGYFADYPPGYIYVLGLVGLIRKAFAIPYEAKLTYLLLAFVPVMADCAATALVWLVGERTIGTGAALTRLTMFAAFCPLLLFNTGVWKQIDSAFALPLLLCFILLEKKRYLPAALLYGVSLAIKPQALLAGPVLAVCFLAGVADAAAAPDREKQLPKSIGRIFGGAALALAPALLAGLPFYGARGLVSSLLEKYIGTTSSYPYATINAFNWFAALGGNWAELGNSVFGIFTWQSLGVINIALVTAALAFLAVKSWRAGRFSPLLLAAFYTVGIFTLAHCMHERYLVLGVLLVLLAAARWGDIRLFGAGFGLSLTGFINLATVYTLVGSDDEWLTSDTSRMVASFTGFAETLCFVLLALTAYDILVKGSVSPLAGKAPAKREDDAAQLLRPQTPAPQPVWSKNEKISLLALTVATALLSFMYLGDKTAPQNAMDATGTAEAVTFVLTGDTPAAELWIYPGISTGGNLVLSYGDGTTFTKELNYGTCFSWTKEYLQLEPGQTVTATLTNAQCFELALRAADGTLLPVEGGGALFDEQAAVPETISQLNSMYFDEIYHGRTGYELLHGLTVYETTHPPLGKDFIMLGIALFGMTGFGWRFSGTLFGVLLVPLMWCFVRRLTRKPWAAAAAACLLAADCMRFAQSRIATIDIYGTFFILLGAYFMLCYCQSVLKNGVCKSVLPMALGGVAFGLGCASKWTGIYAGAGLAVLYLAVLYARSRQKQPGFKKEFAAAAVGGVVFYIAVPIIIYIGAYLPYRWRDPSFGLADVWDSQTYMYWYHSTLEATHPFESRWYTWLLDIRPVWYYMNSYTDAGMKASIAGMGNMLVWLAGLFAVLVLLWRQVSGRGSRAGGAVLILYATQLIPWMMVSRCTFIYHYFPSLMFCIAAVAVLLAQMKDEQRAKKYALTLCAAAVVVFVLYYPAVSGLPIPEAWANALKILPSYGFY